MPLNLELINLLVTCLMIGVIWMVQLVHYPSFSYIEPAKFLDFHQHHSQSISMIVLPLMVIELGLAAYLCWFNNFQISYLLPLILVILLWMSTFFIQVPLHQKLGVEMNVQQITKLVQTNWIRTILWTGKGIWLAWIFR